SPFHKDLAYHEQKGAGHWWDGPAAPGADCLEWPDMIDFLRAHTLRKATSIDFTTCNLAVNNHDAGVTVLEQRHPLAPSRITVSAQQVETSNITRFQLSKEMNTVNLVIDGHAVNPSPSGCYALIDNRWKADTNDRVAQIGPFKQVFNKHVM